MNNIRSLNKFIQSHPILTPEAFQTHLFPQECIRALYISSNKDSIPQILTDTPEKIISYVFLGAEYDYLYPDLYYHVLYSTLDQLKITRPNHTATMLVRNAYLTLTGVAATDAIYGDVLIFGTYNYILDKFDQGHHSIPYEVVEQAYRLDAIKNCL